MERRENKMLKAANIFGDCMVLQRNKSLKIWGTAIAKARVTLSLQSEIYETLADSKGKWEVMLAPREAGGPYNIEIKMGKEVLQLRDILFGDVWLCSGQSNMELPVARVMEKYRDEVNSYENSCIRAFKVGMAYDFNIPQEEIAQGKWISVNKEEVQNFTAIGYFFARELYERYKVPIGLIDTSVGGSRLECWMNEEELMQYPDIMSELTIYKDNKRVKQMMETNEKEIAEWFSRLEEMDGGLNGSVKWFEPKIKTDGWGKIQIPGRWQEQGIDIAAGSIWFKKVINIDEELLSRKARLFLGTIVDSDRVYVNGIEVGRTEYQYPPRIYTIPEGVLKAGENIITIRAVENSNQGQFTAEKFYGLEIGQERIDLSGQWLYKIGAEIEPLTPQIFLQFKPLGLYNAMIYPIRNTEICGVIWYQGESNTEQWHGQYKERFEQMIKSWRKLWRNDKLPFLYAQLTSYGKKTDEPVESQWAEIRQAQLEALEVPYTAMAVTIDVGEWNDLHPLDKKDVGQRLALAAKVIAYGEDFEYSGPIVKEAESVEGKVIIKFEHAGNGLASKNGEELKAFSISADNKHFMWAEAKIEGNQLVVWNKDISHPSVVRYGWSDSPLDANLCNGEGLMASPFKIMCRR